MKVALNSILAFVWKYLKGNKPTLKNKPSKHFLIWFVKWPFLLPLSFERWIVFLQRSKKETHLTVASRLSLVHDALHATCQSVYSQQTQKLCPQQVQDMGWHRCIFDSWLVKVVNIFQLFPPDVIIEVPTDVPADIKNMIIWPSSDKTGLIDSNRQAANREIGRRRKMKGRGGNIKRGKWKKNCGKTLDMF